MCVRPQFDVKLFPSLPEPQSLSQSIKHLLKPEP